METEDDDVGTLNQEERVSLTAAYIGSGKRFPDRSRKVEFALLPTAQFRLRHAYGVSEPIRALVDSGAQTNLITLYSVNQHRLPIEATDVRISGISQAAVTTSGIVRGEICTETSIETGIIGEFVVIPQITSNMPLEYLDGNISSTLKPNIMADSTWCVPGPIEAIIGAGTMAMLMTGEMQSLEGEYVAQNTQLGYIVFGSDSRHMRICTASCNLVTNEELNESLLRLWQSEQNAKMPELTADDLWCEEQFKKTHYRDAAGRFVIEYPIRPERLLEIGNTRETVLKLFYNMERRLENNPECKAKYVEFMRAYEADGHMQVAVDVPGYEGPFVYIPHHPLPADKKFRVVFNGSMRSSTKMSLNDLQCEGPRLQKLLFQLVVQFRIGRVAMSADIKKMFRQVRIVPNQYNLQRIVFRETPKEPLREYQLTVVTYGLRSSPYENRGSRLLCEQCCFVGNTAS